MEKSIRVQRKRTKGWRMPENTVYVGRGSKYGNPYMISDDCSREEAISLYEEYMRPFAEDFKKELKGKNLACWCPLDKACHADVLLKLINS